MALQLLKIPGVEPEHETAVRIRALAFVSGEETTSEVLSKLAEWSKSEPSDHKKIINAMKIAALTKRGLPISEKHVTKCGNSAYGDVYEFRANAGKPRVMFFYLEPNLIVCTNTFWKTNARENQDNAFKKCSQVRNLCLQNQSLTLT